MDEKSRKKVDYGLVARGIQGAQGGVSLDFSDAVSAKTNSRVRRSSYFAHTSRFRVQGLVRFNFKKTLLKKLNLT